MRNSRYRFSHCEASGTGFFKEPSTSAPTSAVDHCHGTMHFQSSLVLHKVKAQNSAFGLLEKMIILLADGSLVSCTSQQGPRCSRTNNCITSHRNMVCCNLQQGYFKLWRIEIDYSSSGCCHKIFCTVSTLSDLALRYFAFRSRDVS